VLVWISFIAIVCALLALDLGVFHRHAHAVSTKEAFRWTGVWVSLSLSFSIFVYYAYTYHWFGIGETVGENLTGSDAALKYLTGYLIEQSLSVDNIFVIALIFAYFKIPQKYQHRVLFWGILGAVVFRGLMIALGVVLINNFSWITYAFGALLLFSAYKMLTSRDEDIDPENNPVILFVKRFVPVVRQLHGEKFFVRKMGIRAATPLFIALMVIETTDIMFAIDSIPAIFAVTTDPFIVFTSNIFAILGLRSLYFVLASVLEKFRYLQYSLVFILAFVGVKMILLHHVHLPEWISLAVVVVFLAAGIVASIILDDDKKVKEQATSEENEPKAVEEVTEKK